MTNISEARGEFLRECSLFEKEEITQQRCAAYHRHVAQLQEDCQSAYEEAFSTAAEERKAWDQYNDLRNEREDYPQTTSLTDICEAYHSWKVATHLSKGKSSLWNTAQDNLK